MCCWDRVELSWMGLKLLTVVAKREKKTQLWVRELTECCLLLWSEPYVSHKKIIHWNNNNKKEEKGKKRKLKFLQSLFNWLWKKKRNPNDTEPYKWKLWFHLNGKQIYETYKFIHTYITHTCCEDKLRPHKNKNKQTNKNLTKNPPKHRHILRWERWTYTG